MAERQEDHNPTTRLDDGQPKGDKRHRNMDVMRIVLLMPPATPARHLKLDIGSQQ